MVNWKVNKILLLKVKKIEELAFNIDLLCGLCLLSNGRWVVICKKMYSKEKKRKKTKEKPVFFLFVK